ncbi:hypothetical protein C8J57DRAFT_1254608 [Mycena rebaudengoi]|nr:hypothetical protein C8J57DRAFT_1254608 [Mycena rebaudengoi]
MSEKGKKRVEETFHHWTGSERDAESPMLQTSFLRCGMLVEEKVRRRAQIMSEWRQWRRLHATFGGCGEYLMFNSGGEGRGRLTSGATCSIWIPEVIFGHQGVSDDVRHLRMGHPFESREVEGPNAIFGHILPGHLILDFPTFNYWYAKESDLAISWRAEVANLLVLVRTLLSPTVRNESVVLLFWTISTWIFFSDIRVMGGKICRELAKDAVQITFGFYDCGMKEEMAEVGDRQRRRRNTDKRGAEAVLKWGEKKMCGGIRAEVPKEQD